MTGYRFCRVVDGKLVSPFAYDPMPEDGLMIASTPVPFGRNGIHVYLTIGEAIAGARFLHPEPMAITAGTIIGGTMPEGHMQPYLSNNDWVSLPMGRRAARYQVETIYTDVAVDHDIPVHPLSELGA